MARIHGLPATSVSVEFVESSGKVLINRHFKITNRFFDMSREEAYLVYKELHKEFRNEQLFNRITSYSQ